MFSAESSQMFEKLYYATTVVPSNTTFPPIPLLIFKSRIWFFLVFVSPESGGIGGVGCMIIGQYCAMVSKVSHYDAIPYSLYCTE